MLARRRASNGELQTLSPDDLRDGEFDLTAMDLVWVDVRQPDSNDIDWLERTFNFHPLALEDVALRGQRGKIDEYRDYYFGVVYAARCDASTRHITSAELQFFWGATYLVTLHSDPFPDIDDLAGRAVAGALSPVIGAGDRRLAAADIMYRMLDSVVDGYFPAIDAVAEWSEDIEESMFAPSRRAAQPTLQAIFSLKKDLLQLRKTTAPSRDVINVVLRRDHALYSDELLPYFQDVYDHTVRVIDSLDTYRDLLASALDTHLSIVSNDVSQTVKKMTAVTAILMVDALVAGVYGMNFDLIPELHWAYGYPFAIALMLLLSFALWLVFKRIEWW